MIKRSILWLAAGATLASGGAAPARTTPIALTMQRVAAVATASGLTGEIAISDRDGIVADRAFGLADRQTRRPHRPGQRWLWASVTKQVTALLVMQQVEAGTLSLDGTIATYLPGFPGTSGDRITLRQLLQHTTGLPNPDDTPANASGMPSFYDETGAAIIHARRANGYCAGKPKAEPGAGFAYNNCDYLVLGAILERATGRSYAALVADRIAKPLGLRSLRVAADGAIRGGAPAAGYDAAKPAPPVNVATFGAAGALTGSARDLLALDRALIAGKLLKPATRAILWRGDPKLGYEALGVWSFTAELKGCTAPVTLIERRGDVGGIQVRNIIAPDIGRAIVVFANDDSLDFGEVWQGKGLSFDLLSAAFCPNA